MKKTKAARRLSMLLLIAGLLLTLPLTSANAARRKRAPDFNGDTMDDLAVGAPGHAIRDSRGAVLVRNAGAVSIFYGSYDEFGEFAGLFTQDGSPLGDIAGTPEEGDLFGSALAWGDFNGDGFDDLAVGAPGQSVGGAARAGVVHIIYGSAFGLVPYNNQQTNQLWYQGARQGILGVALKGTPQEDDKFGSALASGDFNDDGYDDLAIGVPNDQVNGFTSAGAVHVIYGSANGLTAAGRLDVRPENQLWHQGVLHGAVGTDDRFGYALATGDFDMDGDDDLAVGVPWDDVGDVASAGSVNVIFGSNGGLTEQGNVRLYQGHAQTGDMFGFSLAAGDFAGAGYTKDDLAIGIPGKDVHTTPPPCYGLFNCLFRYSELKEDAGAVMVVYASPGLIDPSFQIFNEETDGIPGSVGTQEYFGYALAVGDFSGDDIDDLAIGVPYQPTDEVPATGKVTVIYGGRTQLSGSGSQSWSQGSLIGEQEASDRFGCTLSAGDYNHDGIDDLAVGVPGDNVLGIAYRAGAVNVIFGSWSTLTSGLDGSGPSHALSAHGNKLLVKLTDLWTGISQPDVHSNEYFGGREHF